MRLDSFYFYIGCFSASAFLIEMFFSGINNHSIVLLLIALYGWIMRELVIIRENQGEKK